MAELHLLSPAGFRAAGVYAGIKTRQTPDVGLLICDAPATAAAVFTTNNRKTIGALHALAGRAEPLALVGFDDFELADLLGITVVRADASQVGAQAAALAFARLDGDERPPQRVTIPTRLLVRGSGERVP